MLPKINKPKAFYTQDESNSATTGLLNRYFSSWDVYPTQAMALNSLTSDRMIFSFQYNPNEPGKRKYLVTELSTFYGKYANMEARHYYELIHGRCHLYFDIEFEIKENVDSIAEDNLLDSFPGSYDEQIARGNEMLKLFKEFVSEQLFKVLQDSDFKIIELDSTTRKKYSRHLIYRHSRFCFSSNIVVGHLVQFMISNMTEDLKMKLNLGEEDNFKCFVDVGVYSRNRNFRIWKSSKIEKNKSLEYLDARPLNFNDFVESLVTTTEGYETFNQLDFPDKKEAVSIKSDLSSRLSHVVPVPSDDHYEVKYALLKISGASSLTFKIIPGTRILIATMIGNRFCLNVNREHKSNNVYYYVNLERGTCHQRCFDPDCKGFKGPEYSIYTCEMMERDLFEGVSDGEISQLFHDSEENEKNFIFESVSDSEIAAIEEPVQPYSKNIIIEEIHAQSLLEIDVPTTLN